MPSMRASPSVNVAQRLEQLGKEVTHDAQVVVLASDSVLASSGADEAFEPVGSWTLRGRAKPVSVYSLRATDLDLSGSVVQFPSMDTGTGNF